MIFQVSVPLATLNSACVCATQAWGRVVSDGGPCRWFTPHDVPALVADLRRLGGLFEAEGDGLPRWVYIYIFI